jgi:hypothetical protein
MSKAGLFLVITVTAVLCASAFEIFATDVVRSSAGRRCLERQSASGAVVRSVPCGHLNQRQVNTDAPPLEEIAKRAKFSERAS